MHTCDIEENKEEEHGVGVSGLPPQNRVFILLPRVISKSKCAVFHTETASYGPKMGVTDKKGER